MFFLVPPFHMLVTSFRTSAEISSQAGSPWIVRHPTLANYLDLIRSPNFQGFFWNSLKVTFCVVVLSMVISTLAAFSLARMRFWGSAALATGIFLTYLVPESLLFIPLFKIVGAFNLINNAWAMVPLYLTLSVPFCTWIMIGYFSSIPQGARRGGAD